MIFRPIKFQVMYRAGDKWSRDNVKELRFAPDFGANYVITENVGEFPLDPLQTSLLQFTGFFDKEGAEIYHAHLLKDAEGNIFDVIHYSGKFALQHGQDDPIELSHESAANLTIIGDEFNEAALLIPENAEAAFEKITQEGHE